MPQVPVATNDVNAIATPSGGLQAPDYGAGIGPGLKAVGEGIDQYAKGQAEIETQINEAGAKQAFARYTAYRDQRLLTDNDAYYQLQGQAALNARPVIEQQLADKRTEIAQSLPSEWMRNTFNTIAGTEAEKDNVGIADYYGKASKTYNDQTDSALQWQMGNTATIAALNGDQAGFHTAMGTMVASIRTQNARNGELGPYGQQIEEKAVSGLYQNVINQMATKDPIGAQAYFDAHRADIQDQDTVLAIEKQLQPYVEDAHADNILNTVTGTGLPVPGTAPTSDDATLATKIGGAENSTGNPAAKNPHSSAQGPAQFTDQTWLATLKQHGAPELAGAITKQGHRYVIADTSKAGAIWAGRNDPTMSHEMTIASARDNKVALGHAGVPVNDGTLYLAHFLGTKGAINVLSADPSTPIEQVTSAQARNANPKVLTGTVGDVTAWAYRKMGGSGPTSIATNAPRTDDLNTILARVDALDVPLPLKEKIREKAMQRASLDQRLLDAQQQDAANKAWTVALDPSTTSIRSIPPEVWANVKPEEQRTIMEALKHNADGTNAPANPDLYISLSDKAANGTLTFPDVRAAYGKMPKADFDHFATLAGDIQKGDATGKTGQVTTQTINAVVGNAIDAAIPLTSATLKKADLDTFKATQNARRYQLQKALFDDVQVWRSQPENKGKTPDARTIQAMADRRLLQTNVGATTPGWFGGKPAAPSYQFELQRGPGNVHVRIPNADVNRISADFQRGAGRAPTQAEIVNIYTHEARGG